jgi:hypothetical protein
MTGVVAIGSGFTVKHKHYRVVSRAVEDHKIRRWQFKGNLPVDDSIHPELFPEWIFLRMQYVNFIYI